MQTKLWQKAITRWFPKTACLADIEFNQKLLNFAKKLHKKYCILSDYMYKTLQTKLWQNAVIKIISEHKQQTIISFCMKYNHSKPLFPIYNQNVNEYDNLLLSMAIEYA